MIYVIMNRNNKMMKILYSKTMAVILEAFIEYLTCGKHAGCHGVHKDEKHRPRTQNTNLFIGTSEHYG